MDKGNVLYKLLNQTTQVKIYLMKPEIYLKGLEPYFN